ncbi:hypothetical protein JCM14244_16570 [Venenivibrio stagnispumantis]|uniref:SWIM zinc finger n=1 Tax=Venenivibrio stagnispumantis TaxID=407998 RepID=A0AA45WPI4_9AQUI|nr:SWIM zinc finger family protein [Venenivibrio stagnispumantis]MCW4573989.1 SWIM zinc finger family protein [Venenivibrio stagnispumantis]SMP21090.1 SWIM zinc finger [Venenivibrio stagnispumantis]
MANIYCNINDLNAVKETQKILLEKLKKQNQENHNRFIRAKELVEKGLIKEMRIDKGKITAKVKDYDVVVNLETSSAKCTCPDAKNRKVACKHILAVVFKAENFLGKQAVLLETKKKNEPKNKEEFIEKLFYEAISDLATYVSEEYTDGFFSLAQRYAIKLKQVINK